MHAPAAVIARWIIDRGGASSREVLTEFRMDRWSLRRRRQALACLGVRFFEHGSGSHYLPIEGASIYVASPLQRTGSDTQSKTRAREAEPASAAAERGT